MTPQASLLVTIGIPALTLVVVALSAYAVWWSAPRDRRVRWCAGYVGVTLTLLGGLLAVASTGFFLDVSALPPRPLFVLLPVVALPVALSRSRVGAQLASALPIWSLVGLQAFRLPLELVMHQAAREGTMPLQMTFTGWNFDIVTGVAAVVVGLLAWRRRAPLWLVWGFNVLGWALLVAVVAIAIASLPQLRAFGDDPSRVNTWVLHPPFVWLPAGLVSSGLLWHLVLTRKLLAGEPHGVLVAERRIRGSNSPGPDRQSGADTSRLIRPGAVRACAPACDRGGGAWAGATRQAAGPDPRATREVR